MCSHIEYLFNKVDLQSLKITLQAFEELFSSVKFLNLMEQLLGTKDILGHPVWNLRCKTPNNEATTVPWHQGMTICMLTKQELQYFIPFFFEVCEYILHIPMSYFVSTGTPV